MIKDFAKSNPAATFSLAGAAAVMLFCLAASGCAVEDLINVDVPKGVRNSLEIEGSVSLGESDQVWTDWNNYVRQNTDRFERETASSYELLGFVTGVTDLAIGAASNVAPAFPGGAIMVGILSGAAGLWVKKPGTAKVIAKEKEDSYRAGMDKAIEVSKLVSKATEEIDGSA
jgi:hypothetical protein